jgi:hypothetical protein
MFDFSAAGPLFGMIASLFAVTVGSQLTTTADPATLPSMPLEILRQSSLAGGILDAVIGNGVLSVPDGALGTSAVSTMTIPLHPIAVAGFIGLIVNALNVLPIGSKFFERILVQRLFSQFLTHMRDSNGRRQNGTNAIWQRGKAPHWKSVHVGYSHYRYRWLGSFSVLFCVLYCISDRK